MRRPISVPIAEVIRHLRENDLLAGNPAAPSGEVHGIATPLTARANDLAWCSASFARAEPAVFATFAGALLLVDDGALEDAVDNPRILPVKGARLAFASTVNRFFGDWLETRWPERSDAHIPASAVIAPGVQLGGDVVIGERVRIGPNSCIANCTIADDVTIGANCSIGLPGFGFERAPNNELLRFPQLGRVQIETGVEIGSNVCIDRGALGDTRIGRGSKIDNLCHIAHNVVIGAHTMVIANSMIAGSATLGDGVWVAPSVSLMNKKSVGDGATLGMGAVVLKDVTAGETIVGNPGRALPPREKK